MSAQPMMAAPAQPPMRRYPYLKPASGTRPVLAAEQRQADSVAVIAEPMLQRLAAYWLSRRAGRPMPARTDIDPIDIPWALSRLFLVDCLTDAGTGADGGRWRYRYRLAGEEIETVFRGILGRHSVRHAWLDEMLSPDKLVTVMQRWRPLPESGHIIYMHGMIYRMADSFAWGGRLMLPLADSPGGPVTGFVGAAECGWRPSESLPLPDSAAAMTVTYIPAAGLD